jgi:hypothetical protein
MPEAVEAEYKRIENILKKCSERTERRQKDSDRLPEPSHGFPDQPYGQPAIRHPCPAIRSSAQNITDADTLRPKEEKVLKSSGTKSERAKRF